MRQLHPLTKLAMNLMALGFTLLWYSPGPPAAALALTLGLLLLVGVPGRDLARALLLLSPLAAIWLVTGALFARTEAGSPVLWALGPWRVTEASALWGLTRTLRILCILAFGWLFLRTTSPTELVLGLVQGARLPASWGYAFLAAFGTLPQLRTELQTLQAARAVRGLIPSRSPASLLRQWRWLGVGLLASAARRSERMALAMESRAFGACPRRTYRRTFRFGLPDIAALALAVAVLSALTWEM